MHAQADAQTLEDINLLDVTPRRTAAWQQVDGRVVLERPRPAVRGMRGLMRRLSYYMLPRKIRLDSVGTFAWERFDGHRTVGQVAAQLREHCGADAEPAEHRLGEFVRILRRHGVLAYAGWDDDSAHPALSAPAHQPHKETGQTLP